MTAAKNTRKIPARLSRRSFLKAVQHLADGDPDLAEIVQKFSPLPVWFREEGFHSLIHIILEQQVSLSSAKAAYDRLIAAATPLTPERFLQFSDTELKTFGFSRQKTAYCRNLSHAILQGGLDLGALRKMNDAAVKSELTKIKGIGIWTADIYLLTALRRPDVWPRGDLALAVAIQRIKGLTDRPSLEQMDAFAAGWRPWRAVAARLLWHYYLNNNHRGN